MSTAEHGGTRQATPVGLRPKQLLRIRAIWVMPLAVVRCPRLLDELVLRRLRGESARTPERPPRGPGRPGPGGDGPGSPCRHRGRSGCPASSDRTPSASRLTLDTGGLAQAEQQMKTDNTYATIVIPSGFTDSLLSAYGLAPTSGTSGTGGKPTVHILTNPRAGSIGVSLATGLSQPALHAASLEVGRPARGGGGHAAPDGEPGVGTVRTRSRSRPACSTRCPRTRRSG